MFVEDFFASNAIKKIFEKGEIGIDEPIFEEFNTYLRGIGLDVALSTFHRQPQKSDLSENASDNGNDIAIYLRTNDNFIKNGLDANGNWSHGYPHTKDIMEKWKELAAKHNFPKTYYDYIAHVFFYDFENMYLAQLTANSKIHFLDKVKKADWEVKPKYIFCSGEPALNIIYDKQIDYDKACSKNYFGELTKQANYILSVRDILKMFREGSVHICFYHTEMDINLYGMSRED